MIRRPPRSTRTATLFPSTARCRSGGREARGDRRRERHAEARRGAVGHELGQIGSLDGIAAGEHHDWARRSKPGDVVEQGATLARVELQGAALVHGVSPAVGAHELAGPGHLPEDYEGAGGGIEVEGPDGTAGGHRPSARWARGDAPGTRWTQPRALPRR